MEPTATSSRQIKTKICPPLEPEVLSKLGEGAMVKYLFFLSAFLNTYKFKKVENKMAKFNRPIDEKRCKDMYKRQIEIFRKRGYFTLFATNDIVLGSLRGKNSCPEVIDGQHRLTIAKWIARDYPDQLKNIKLVVSIYYADNQKDLEDYFKEINRNSQAVPKCYLSKTELDEKVNKEALKFTNNYLLIHYLDYISNSRNCKRPNMNLNVIYENLAGNRYFRHLVTDVEKDDNEMTSAASLFFRQVKKYNEILKTKDASYFLKGVSRGKQKSTINIFKKAHGKNPVLLIGMFPHGEWIQKVLDQYFNR